MSASDASAKCALCGKGKQKGQADLKQCGCKNVFYCSKECQKAAWNGHKKTCVPLPEVFEQFNAAIAASDWREQLKWDGRMEEMMEGQTDATCDNLLSVFGDAYKLGFSATRNKGHALSLVSIYEKRVELLGKMQRFRDQGGALVLLADQLLVLGKRDEGEGYFQRARKLGEAHGFLSVESLSCLGLGKLAFVEGQHEEGVELMRHALVAAPLAEGQADDIELDVLHTFTEALFQTHAIDEVEPLVARYREAVRAESGKKGRLSYYNFHCFYASARLHEVRGTPQEAAREVRALLALMRENGPRVQDLSGQLHKLLRVARSSLKILDPALGEKELIQSVAVQTAKLRAGMAGSSGLQ